MLALRICYRVSIDAYYKFLADDGWAIASHIALSALMSLFPFLILVCRSIDLFMRPLSLPLRSPPRFCCRPVVGCPPCSLFAAVGSTLSVVLLIIAREGDPLSLPFPFAPSQPYSHRVPDGPYPSFASLGFLFPDVARFDRFDSLPSVLRRVSDGLSPLFPVALCSSPCSVWLGNIDTLSGAFC